MKRTILLLLLALPLLAQDRPPVEVVKVTPCMHAWQVYWPELRITYRNISDKQIVGVKFSASYTNPVNETYDIGLYATDRKTNPGDKKTDHWRNYLCYNRRHEGWAARPIKVLFADGSIWSE